MKLRERTRVIEYKNTYDKTVYKRSTKKNNEKNIKYKLKVTNDCILITNLMDTDKYSDNELLNLYRKRWSVEVFFKYLKNNFKFQHADTNYSNFNRNDISNNNYFKRLYICEMILMYLMQIIQCTYLKLIKLVPTKTKTINGKQTVYTCKVNKTNLTTGIFTDLLADIIKGKLTDEQLHIFCKSYIKICINEVNRSYPRTSKKPFSKWYVKGYSIEAKLIKIIEALVNNTVEKLNKNDRTLAKKIKIISGTIY
jgi:hypothetical protein